MGVRAICDSATCVGHRVYVGQKSGRTVQGPVLTRRQAVGPRLFPRTRRTMFPHSRCPAKPSSGGYGPNPRRAVASWTADYRRRPVAQKPARRLVVVTGCTSFRIRPYGARPSACRKAGYDLRPTPRTQDDGYVPVYNSTDKQRKQPKGAENLQQAGQRNGNRNTRGRTCQRSTARRERAQSHSAGTSKAHH